MNLRALPLALSLTTSMALLGCTISTGEKGEGQDRHRPEPAM